MTAKRIIGEALDGLAAEVEADTLGLVASYRGAEERLRESLIRQAIDTPHRARAQVTAWMSNYDANNGSGAAAAFLGECLVAYGSAKTLAQVNAELAALEAQAQTIVNNVAGGWTWDQAADAIENALTPPPPPVSFSYRELPIPSSYVTVWGTSH